jgi:hypothetical protein
MPYVQFDDQYPIVREVDGLSDAAFRLHTSAYFWCSRNGTDGFVPRDDLHLIRPQLATPEQYVAECVRRGVWHDARAVCGSENCLSAVDRDGWIVHDYLQGNPSAGEMRARRAGKSSGGSLGNHRRWHSSRGVVVSGCEWCSPKPGTDQTSDRYTGRHTDRITDRTSDRTSDQSTDRKGYRSTDHSTDRTSDPATDHSTDRTSDLPALALASDRSTDRWSDRPTESVSESDPNPSIPIPIPSDGSVVSHVAGSNGHPTDDDVIIKTIIEAIFVRTGRLVDKQWASTVAKHILQGRTARNPAAYCRQTIENDPDPRTRFLPAY